MLNDEPLSGASLVGENNDHSTVYTISLCVLKQMVVIIVKEKMTGAVRAVHQR